MSALARLAGCASGSPSGTTGIVLEVHPAGQALKCTLVAWQQVCTYIAAGNQARPRSYPIPENAWPCWRCAYLNVNLVVQQAPVIFCCEWFLA